MNKNEGSARIAPEARREDSPARKRWVKVEERPQAPEARHIFRKRIVDHIQCRASPVMAEHPGFTVFVSFT
jgi:hypothetical protein